MRNGAARAAAGSGLPAEQSRYAACLYRGTCRKQKGAAGGLSVQMLQLVTGILWIFPVLAGFLPVIHVSSRLISLDFSLVSLFDGSAWVSQVGGSSLQADVMNQAMGGTKTWMIVLVVLFFIMAVLGIFMD